MRASTQLLWLSGHPTNGAVLILGDFPSSQGDLSSMTLSRRSSQVRPGRYCMASLEDDLLFNLNKVNPWQMLSRRPRFLHCTRFPEQGSFAIFNYPTLIASIIPCRNPEDSHPDDDWNP
jgi:hypothetical protein